MLPPPIVSQLWVCSAEGMVKPKPYERDEGEDVNKAWMLESIDHLKKQKDANDQELARIQQLTPTEKEEEQRRITAAAAQQVVEASNAVALARATGEDEFQSLALSTMSRGSMISETMRKDLAPLVSWIHPTFFEAYNKLNPSTNQWCGRVCVCVCVCVCVHEGSVCVCGMLCFGGGCG